MKFQVRFLQQGLRLDQDGHASRPKSFRQPWFWGGGHKPEHQEPLAALTDHLPDLALPKHDYGEQVPGEARA